MTETFAHWSNDAVYSATFVFVFALVAHMAEWAMARTLHAAPVATGERPLVGATAAATPTAAVRTAMLGSEAGEGSAVLTAERPPVTAAPVTVESAPPPGDVDSEDEVERSDRFGRIGLALTVLGLILLTIGVIFRGVAAHRVPWGNMYEFATTGCVMMCAAYLVMVGRYHVRWLGLAVTGFLSVVLGLSVVVLYRPISPLVPALHSYWLMIHVSSAAVAGGAYTVGALASVLFLMRSHLEAKAAKDPSLPRTGFLWRAPDSESIDRVAYRVHAFAFPMWTFAVMCGAIWAQYAWGRFWGWDPKETWAFITWVAYAAYLHARATSGWRGKAAAYVALFGYATFLFNFIGINLFGSGLHSYSGM